MQELEHRAWPCHGTATVTAIPARPASSLFVNTIDIATMSLHDIVHASQPENPLVPPPGPSKLPVRSWRSVALGS